jgi:glyoxylase I family protein
MSSIQHIAFNCSDIQRMEQFYSRHFGFKRVRVFNRGKPDEFLMLRLKSTCLELFKAPVSNPSVSPPDASIGFKHLAFEVEDLDATIQKLQADGIHPDPVINCSSIIPGMKVCFFVDPNGTRLELMQGYEDEVDS